MNRSFKRSKEYEQCSYSFDTYQKVANMALVSSKTQMKKTLMELQFQHVYCAD